MKSSYKITFASVALLCVVILVYYTTQGSPEGTDAFETVPAPPSSSSYAAGDTSGSYAQSSAQLARSGSAATNRPTTSDATYRPRMALNGSAIDPAGDGLTATNSISAEEADSHPPMTLTLDGHVDDVSVPEAAAIEEFLAADNNTDDGEATDTTTVGTGALAMANTNNKRPFGPEPLLRAEPTRTSPAVRSLTGSSTLVASSESATSAIGNNANASRPTTNANKTYTIQSGDTFSSIAIRNYGSDRYWIDIAQANPLVDPARLKVGTEIRLPSSDQLRASDGTSPAAPGQETSYTIRSGDSLSTVASKFYKNPGKWKLIWRANRDQLGSNPDALQPGMKLRIPPDPNPAR